MHFTIANIFDVRCKARVLYLRGGTGNLGGYFGIFS